MSKRDQLKNSMQGGLNALLTPNSKKDNWNKTVTSALESKEKPVHCNFVIEKSIHTRMKYLAIERNMSLKEIVNEAMKEYLDKYEQ